MTVTFYQSTDASAPVLTSAAGSLGAVLNAILVAGYGSKSAAGWSAVVSGSSTHQWVFAQAAGNTRRLQVDDSAASGLAAYARVLGAESGSSFGSLTNPFPTNTQQSGGLYWARCQAGTAGNAVRWACIATGQTFHFWNENDTTLGSSGDQQVFTFGDIDSYVSGDVYGTVIGGGTSNFTNNACNQVVAAGLSTNLAGWYTCREYTGAGTSIASGRHTDQIKTLGVTQIGGVAISSSLVYPSPEDGLGYVLPIWCHESAVGGNSIRGVVSGIWFPTCLYTEWNSFDSPPAVSALSGKTLVIFRIYSNGIIAFETSNTWS